MPEMRGSDRDASPAEIFSRGSLREVPKEAQGSRGGREVMDEVVFKEFERPKLNRPIVIEGLPGVGNVGKLAAEHLVDELKAKKFMEIYSRHFPPQVLINDDGVLRLVRNELYYHKARGREASDLILLVGDYQGLSPDGQYELSWRALDVLDRFKPKRLYTLGGWGIGKMIEAPRVLGAATSLKLVSELKKVGVTFSKGEPGGGIVGASGLLLGLGHLRGYEGACLMGETSGYFVDPKSAEAVLQVLAKALRIKLDFSALHEKAQQIEMITSKLKDSEAPIEPKKENLDYIA
jgi:hypothetical protein